MRGVHQGECLDFLRQYEGPPFDLVYLDPPFFLDKKFEHTIGSDLSFRRGWDSESESASCSARLAPHNDELRQYLEFLERRLRKVYEHLSPTGSFFLHIGQSEGAYLKCILDDIFGIKMYRTTITWQRSHPHNNVKFAVGGTSDFIYYYTKSDNFTFNLQYTPHDEVYLANCFHHEDENGPYALAPVLQEKSRRGHKYEINGFSPTYGWRIRLETYLAYEKAGRIHWGANRPYKKIYLHEAKGTPLQNIWTDVYNITRTEKDRRLYPTQKPEKLLERIVLMASKEGDLVFDPFCGSGTTIIAAERLGRSGLGVDVSPAAIEVAKVRLKQIATAANAQLFA